jgi:hypothetical protein
MAAAVLPCRACAQVNKLVREIEVSHWGNIYVEETYEIVSCRWLCSCRPSSDAISCAPGSVGLIPECRHIIVQPLHVWALEQPVC